MSNLKTEKGDRVKIPGQKPSNRWVQPSLEQILARSLFIGRLSKHNTQHRSTKNISCQLKNSHSKPTIHIFSRYSKSVTHHFSQPTCWQTTKEKPTVFWYSATWTYSATAGCSLSSDEVEVHWTTVRVCVCMLCNPYAPCMVYLPTWLGDF